jgi:hypothetical protein
MRYALIGALVAAALCAYAIAQTLTQVPKTVSGYLVIAACGTMPVTLVAGTYVPATVNLNGRLCVQTTAP